MDGLVAVAACDKNMPGCIMSMARLNIPSIFVYGGAILPGNFHGKDINIQDMFEAVGSWSRGQLSEDDLTGMEKVACPGEGACSGDVHGEHDVVGHRRRWGCRCPARLRYRPSTGAARESRMRRARLSTSSSNGTSSRATSSRKRSLENAMMVVLAMGGSTNAVLHLLAIGT